MDHPSFADHRVDINGGQKIITVRHGASLLAGLAKNGILLPSACGGNARCGTCKIKVEGGVGRLLPQEEPLISPEEKAALFRLSCQVKVETDLRVEVAEAVFAVKQFSGTLVAKQSLTHDIVRLRVALVKPETIEFTAGQYVQLRSLPYGGKEAVIRAFSIASAPSDKTYIEFMVRKVSNGVCTAWIFERLREGDKVYFTAPYGSLRLSKTASPILFIAGGSGMAPIWSMLCDMKQQGKHRTSIYFFGALTRRDLFLVNELNALQKELPWFAFVPALSNEPAGSDWTGERGLITEVLARRCMDCSGYEAYLCGSPGMIESCRKVLLKCGVAEENIFYDKFT